MEKLTILAFVSIARGCGFAGLGIFCLVAGLSYDPVLAAKTGAILTTGLAVILIFRAQQAPFRDYRKTELWVMLKKDERPVAEQAQKLTGQTLKDTYYTFANHVAVIAAIFWGIALLLWLTLPEGFMLM
ncbi:MAG: hypothetical protein R3D43_07550 [Tepidamorphaceae bacterium]|nr:hypothetical protein [Rhodobiaceae bacterium]MCC0050203.1 hypothetical protein [Rhodobiaceae bacterium]